MPSPDVSVVMSVYNGARSLRETIASVLDQKDCLLEFIVVNDGSVDESGDILDEWARRDPRLRVLHQSNEGLTRALIRGCDQARASYIARQDCGDVSLPGRLSQQLAEMRANPRLTFVSCWTRYSSEEGDFLYEERGSGIATVPTSIINLDASHGVLDGPTCHGSVMFRRDAYRDAGGYRREFYFGQDWDLWYRLAERGLFKMLPVVLCEVRWSASDISMREGSRQRTIAGESLRALRMRLAGESDQPALKAAAQIRPSAGKKHWRGGAGRGSYFLGECLRRNGNREAAQRYFQRSIRENPFQLKSWARLLQVRLG